MLFLRKTCVISISWPNKAIFAVAFGSLGVYEEQLPTPSKQLDFLTGFVFLTPSNCAHVHEHKCFRMVRHM